MIKGELKDRLKLLKLPLKTFLENLGYHAKHLNRYKAEEEVPLVFQYALLLLEKEELLKKTQEILNGHKKIISLLVEKREKQEPKIGDMCFFWNKNSELLLIAPLGKIDGLFYPKAKVKRGYHFCEKFVGSLPKKFHVKFFSTISQVNKKDSIDAVKI